MPSDAHQTENNIGPAGAVRSASAITIAKLSEIADSTKNRKLTARARGGGANTVGLAIQTMRSPKSGSLATWSPRVYKRPKFPLSCA